MIKECDGYKLILTIADDYYSATMSIEYLLNDTESIYDEVIDFLEENSISYGLKEEEINEVCSSKENVYDFLIAEGKPHKNGKDAELKYHVSFENNLTPKIMEDGSVDFKEMDFGNTVAKGDLLVSKIPGTEGLDGITVTNKNIKCKNGKDIKIIYGENSSLSEDGLELVSDIDGIVKNVNGRVMVMKVIELTRVGPETGNVYFSGDVRVKENILDGYTVNCDGDLLVDGVVEGSILKVKGNLIVGRGIMGHGESDIVVNGNLISKFIENANIYVKGKIETGEIINSSVLCDGQITVKGKKGLIIGGEITSKYLIDANRIGSKLGVITSINLGVDASAIMELKNLKEIVQELKIVEGKLEMMLPILESKLIKYPDDDLLDCKLKQYKDSLRSTRIDLEEKNKSLSILLEALKKVKNGRIKTNTIYPDTVVKIGNSSYFIDHALKDCVITRADDKVIAIGI